MTKKMNKLKKLNEIFTENTPCFVKMKMALEEWKVAYEKRVLVNDSSVIKFIEHLCENENTNSM